MNKVHCNKLIALVIIILFSGCNLGDTGTWDRENLLIYTQADMDRVLVELQTATNELGTCMANQRRCPICPTAVPVDECVQEECTPAHFGPEVCAYACTVEKYSCIYKCWNNTNGYECAEICTGEYNTCQASCR